MCVAVRRNADHSRWEPVPRATTCATQHSTAAEKDRAPCLGSVPISRLPTSDRMPIATQGTWGTLKRPGKGARRRGGRRIPLTVGTPFPWKSLLPGKLCYRRPAASVLAKKAQEKRGRVLVALRCWLKTKLMGGPTAGTRARKPQHPTPCTPVGCICILAL